MIVYVWIYIGIYLKCKPKATLNEKELKTIAKNRIKNIKNVCDYQIKKKVVHVKMSSISGKTTWEFWINFNDNGKISGNYQVSSMNDDSDIPSRLAETISDDISNILGHDISDQDEWDEKFKFARKIILLIVMIIIFSVGDLGYYEWTRLTPIGANSEMLIGKSYKEAESAMENAGFTHIKIEAVEDLNGADIANENKVTAIYIGWDNSFTEEQKFPSNFPVKIIYHKAEPIEVPISSKEAKKYTKDDIKDILKKAGFINIKVEPEYDLILGVVSKEYYVESIIINGDKKFSEGDLYSPTTEIVIKYHEYKKKP